MNWFCEFETPTPKVGGENCQAAVRKEIFQIYGCAVSMKVSGWNVTPSPFTACRHDMQRPKTLVHTILNW